MSVREAGMILSWDGERGEIRRFACSAHEARRLAFAAADVLEGEPAMGNRCTFSPGPDDTAVTVRAKADW